VAGYFIAEAWGGSFAEAMFIGAAMVATSVGITARVLGGMGIAILSTPRGVLSGREAKKQNVGGELLAYVW